MQFDHDSQMNSEEGDRLIFLVSQPRTGSTLLQRILGQSQDIHTSSEAWVLLRPLWGISTGRVPGTASYDSAIAQSALEEFIAGLPDGITDYYRGCALMYSYLYKKSLQDSGRQFYLDKTPRYYTILREIAQVFPKAKFIILARNPLAVMESILRTYLKLEWAQLYRHRGDLLIAPQALIDARDSLGERALYVNYEALIANPTEIVGRICSFLGVRFDERMITSYLTDIRRWSLGDPVTIYQERNIRGDFRERWKEMLVDPQFRIAAAGYLDALGSKLVAELGYDANALQNEIAARPTCPLVKIFCVNWKTLLSSAFVEAEAHAIDCKRHSLVSRLENRIKRHWIATAQWCRTLMKRPHVPEQ